jgi:hypothetical protein
MVVPIANVEPGTLVVVTAGLVVQLSVAVGAVQVAVVVVLVPTVLTVILAGQGVKEGGVTSVAQALTTVTEKVQVAVLFLASAAV